MPVRPVPSRSRRLGQGAGSKGRGVPWRAAAESGALGERAAWRSTHIGYIDTHIGYIDTHTGYIDTHIGYIRTLTVAPPEHTHWQ